MTLNNRKLAILSLIAREYLRSGEPVGSKAICMELGGAVSSATIRNDMAQLERDGLLYQPHTSAGRIPTALGLHLYIDRLMKRRSLSKKQKDCIDSLLGGAHSVEGAVAVVGEALAEFTNCASFSTVPTASDVCLKQIDFIKTGSHTFVFVILTETNIVKSVFVHLDCEISEDAFNSLANLCKKKLVGTLLCDITPPFVQSLAASLSQYALLFSPFFEALLKVSEELASPGVYVKGQNNLFRNSASLFDAAQALNMLNSESIFNLIEPTSSISIVIPERDSSLKNTAMIYSGYKFSDRLFGSIGVLGPYRLDYEGIIPMIEYFSTSLESMLNTRELYK